MEPKETVQFLASSLPGWLEDKDREGYSVAVCFERVRSPTESIATVAPVQNESHGWKPLKLFVYVCVYYYYYFLLRM